MQKDKLLHFVCSAVITLVTVAIFFLLNCTYDIAALAGVLTGCSAGFTKEFADNLNPYNKWNWKDLLFDGFGIILGLLLGVILYII